jgi:hypothetical protein
LEPGRVELSRGKISFRPEFFSYFSYYFKNVARLPGLAQLDFTVGDLKPISEDHSFRYGGVPYKCLYAGTHTNRRKSPKIAENRR